MSKTLAQKPLYWIIASIISGCISSLLLTFSLEPTGRFSTVCGLLCLFFIVMALVLGLVSVVKIFVNWKARKVMGVLELGILLFSGFWLLGITLANISGYRFRKAIAYTGLTLIKDTGNSLMEYSKGNGHMPDADSWCYLLIDKDDRNRFNFKIPQIKDVECNFAFNKNLGNLSVDGLPDNVVMLFESDGELNLSGGPELITKERSKDKYFRFKKQRFIYVFFVDGTIAKYRLHDGAVALYSPDKDEFTDYFKKDQTPYSPLRWTP